MTSSRADICCAVIFLLMLTTSLTAKVTRRSDDVSEVSLQTVQASVIQTLLAKVLSLETNVKALQDKVDVASSTVAFSVRLSANQDNAVNGVLFGLHQTLVFNEAVTNVGNAYNIHSGIFAAPVAGTYAFFLSIMSTDGRGPVSLAITKNGATLDRVYANGRSDPNDQGSTLVTTHLVKGDQVWVRQDRGDAVRADSWTIFTGFLLQAQ